MVDTVDAFVFWKYEEWTPESSNSESKWKICDSAKSVRQIVESVSRADLKNLAQIVPRGSISSKGSKNAFDRRFMRLQPFLPFP